MIYIILVFLIVAIIGACVIVSTLRFLMNQTITIEPYYTKRRRVQQRMRFPIISSPNFDQLMETCKPDDIFSPIIEYKEYDVETIMSTRLVKDPYSELYDQNLDKAQKDLFEKRLLDNQQKEVFSYAKQCIEVKREEDWNSPYEIQTLTLKVLRPCGN